MEKILIGYYFISYLRLKYILLKKIFQNLINNYNKKIGFLLVYFFLLFDIDPLFSKCNNVFCSENRISFNKENKLSLKEINEKNFSKKSLKIFSKKLFSIPINEVVQLDKLFSNILLSRNEDQIAKDNSNFSYEIEADSQYIENEIYYAEGDVIIFLDEGKLKADKISYDSLNKVFKAYSNIIFKKGNQFFKANYLEFDFLNNKGFIDNVFGILDAKTINKDFNFYKKNSIYDSCDQRDINLIDNPAEVGLLKSSNKRFKNALKVRNINLDFSEIKKWKFKTKKINLNKDKWISNEIDFSNDPFNKTQFIIRSKNFVGEFIGDNIKIISQSNFIIFDDKLTVPIGKRTIDTIDDEIRLIKWGIGYQNDFRDGLYILRNFETINNGDNFSLDLKPYFLLQRAIEGESDSFRDKYSNVISKKVKKQIDFADYFALNSKLNGRFLNWDLNINADLKTFNYKNFYDAFSIDLNLLKNIYRYSNNTVAKVDGECEINKNINYSEEKSLDFGLYSLFEKNDIYFAYGGKLIGKYDYVSNHLFSDFSYIFDFGDYQGVGSNDSSELVSLLRYGANITLNNDFKIINLKDKNLIFNPNFKHTSKIPNQGLFLKTKFAFGLYEYSNNKAQSITSLSFGPSFIFGNLKNKFLDYTEITVLPEFISKKGNSPFKFDDFNNDSRIKFLFKQQLIGPFIFGFESEYNINNNSSNYGDLSNRKFFFQVERRAYSFGLIFEEVDKQIFIGFNLFDFSNINFDKKFE